MTNQMPRFYDSAPQTDQATVVWVPDVDTEQTLIQLKRSVLPATCRFGLSVKVGQTVSVTWIGQTLRIDAIVADVPKQDDTKQTDDDPTSP